MHRAELRPRVEADRHGAVRSYGVGSGGCGQNRGVGGDLPHVGGAVRSYGVGSGGCGQNRGVGGDLPHVGGASGVWRGRYMGGIGGGIARVVAGRGVGGEGEAGIPISPEGVVCLLRKRSWGRRRGAGVDTPGGAPGAGGLGGEGVCAGGSGGVDGEAGRERGGLAERGGGRDGV